MYMYFKYFCKYFPLKSFLKIRLFNCVQQVQQFSPILGVWVGMPSTGQIPTCFSLRDFWTSKTKTPSAFPAFTFLGMVDAHVRDIRWAEPVCSRFLATLSTNFTFYFRMGSTQTWKELQTCSLSHQSTSCYSKRDTNLLNSYEGCWKKLLTKWFTEKLLCTL